MSLGTRRAALRAAAKVALAVSAFGCGGSIDSTTATSSDAAPDQGITRFEAGAAEASAEAALAEAAVDASLLDVLAFDAPLACNVPSPITATTTVDQTMFDCCAALAMADPGGFVPDAGDAAGAACCAAMVQHVNQEFRDAGAQANADLVAMSSVRVGCCDSLGWPGGIACSAWGPPTPPAMPPSMQEVA
jgi:hypothetical protein